MLLTPGAATPPTCSVRTCRDTLGGVSFRWAALLMLGAVAVAAAISVPFADYNRPTAPAPHRSSTAATSTSTTSTTMPRSVTSHPTPNVVGMSLVAAQRVVTSAGRNVAVAVTAEVAKTGVAPETVLSQTQNELTVAVPSASACTSTQLAATYEFNQGGLGNEFASVVLRNTSASWCTIEAPIDLAGIATTGQSVAGPTSIASLSKPTMDVLSPDTPPVPPPAPSLVGTGFGYPLGTFFGWVGFYGPSNTCTPDIPGSSVTRVAPFAWRVTLGSGASAEARNGTPAVVTTPSATASRTATPFETCGGVVHGQGATVRFGNADRLAN